MTFLKGADGNATTLKTAIDTSTQGIKTAIVRLYKPSANAQIYLGWNTPTVIQGDVSVTSRPMSGVDYGLASNYYFIFTLTGFTQIPYSIKAFNNLSSGGFGDADEINIGEIVTGLGSSEALSASSNGYLLGDTPVDILTNFNPDVNKYYLYIDSADTNDWYIMFQGV